MTAAQPPDFIPPPPAPPPLPPAGDTGIVSTLIPYKNKPALIGYYLGVFAFIPVLGVLPGIPAFVLGIMGLRKASRNPEVRGKGHAIVALVGGVLALVEVLVFLWVFIRPIILDKPPGW